MATETKRRARSWPSTPRRSSSNSTLGVIAAVDLGQGLRTLRHRLDHIGPFPSAARSTDGPLQASKARRPDRESPLPARRSGCDRHRISRRVEPLQRRAARVSARSLHKSYHLGETEIAALDGVDLEIGGGELVVAIAGPSGSGKSTLLHLLGALDTAGRAARSRSRVGTSGDALRTRAHAPAPTAARLRLPVVPSRAGALGARERRVPALDRRRSGRRAPPARAGAARRGRDSSDRASASAGPPLGRRAPARRDRPRPGPRPLAVLADEPTGNLDSANGAAIFDLCSQSCAASSARPSSSRRTIRRSWRSPPRRDRAARRPGRSPTTRRRRCAREVRPLRPAQPGAQPAAHGDVARHRRGGNRRAPADRRLRPLLVRRPARGDDPRRPGTSRDRQRRGRGRDARRGGARPPRRSRASTAGRRSVDRRERCRTSSPCRRICTSWA